MKFGIAAVLSWISASVCAVVVCTVWAFATFEQKEVAQERKDDIVKRLDSLDQKIDQLLQRGK